ncbi:DNA adenine methylase [Kerstersia gyiorum]|uniref:DNA adenine methylase n=1 Tax=Kerstersia gyiorum TaxID=206506 RepID=UPI0020A233A3|nr:DNA adenine methylase [Kerstersia gyiorum]MCP1679451.1 hypothetical protein [Kerstersia gyiorum]MCP1823954.1 hypothetical protein [Kerstersia gyiorum]MCP1827395.1 hypothetical protein [Kerstersia gyiorum]MCW2448956.1 hypothetical protein [Kerstersia gyiorum]
MIKPPTRPVMRYHGGKFRLAPWIISHFPPHRTYCEPFGGAASVLMQKPRSYAEVYNDRDDDIVNVMRVLRDPVMRAQLEEAVAMTPYARSEFEAAFHHSDEPVERASKALDRAQPSGNAGEFKTDDQMGFVLAAIQHYGSQKWAEGRGLASADLLNVREAWDSVYAAVQALAAQAQPPVSQPPAAFAEWWAHQQAAAKNRLPGDDFLMLDESDKRQYETCWRGATRAALAQQASGKDREDAEIYRWLRSNAVSVQAYASGHPNWLFGTAELRGETFGAAIAAARAAAKDQ